MCSLVGQFCHQIFLHPVSSMDRKIWKTDLTEEIEHKINQLVLLIHLLILLRSESQQRCSVCTDASFVSISLCVCRIIDITFFFRVVKILLWKSSHQIKCCSNYQDQMILLSPFFNGYLDQKLSNFKNIYPKKPKRVFLQAWKMVLKNISSSILC